MIASPCINVCRMERGVCAGCLRTLDEIAAWGNADERLKARIVAAIAERRRALQPAASGD